MRRPSRHPIEGWPAERPRFEARKDRTMFDNAFSDTIVGGLRIDARFLAAAMDKAMLVLPTKSKQPLLRYVLVEGGKLCASDLEMQIRIDIPAESHGGDGFIFEAAPIRKLLRGINTKISIEARKLMADGTDFTVVTANDAARKTVSMAATDYPSLLKSLPDTKVSMTMTAQQLAQALHSISFAISTEETRYYLNGICFDFMSAQRRLSMVATDGHRLAKFNLEHETQVDHKPIVPRAAVYVLLKLLKDSRGDVRIRISDTKAEFLSADWQFITKLIDGSFPDYDRVVPKMDSDGAATWTMTADKGAILAALAKVSMTEHSQGCVFSPTGTVLCKDGASEAEAPISGAVIVGNAEHIGFQHRYLVQGLKHAPGDRITFWLSSPSAPALVTIPGRDDWSLTLMPIRV